MDTFLTQEPLGLTAAATPIIPDDPAKASAELEAAGWVDADGDGIRGARMANAFFKFTTTAAAFRRRPGAAVAETTCLSAGSHGPLYYPRLLVVR